MLQCRRKIRLRSLFKIFFPQVKRITKQRKRGKKGSENRQGTRMQHLHLEYLHKG